MLGTTIDSGANVASEVPLAVVERFRKTDQYIQAHGATSNVEFTALVVFRMREAGLLAVAEARLEGRWDPFPFLDGVWRFSREDPGTGLSSMPPMGNDVDEPE